jgi:hypothetical protein
MPRQLSAPERLHVAAGKVGSNSPRDEDRKLLDVDRSGQEHPALNIEFPHDPTSYLAITGCLAEVLQ